jgi:hypothetical protein
MRRITVVFMTKQDNMYMVQIEIAWEWDKQCGSIEDQIMKQCPNCKDICYVFDGWSNRIGL